MEIFNCDNDTRQWALIIGSGEFILRDTEDEVRALVQEYEDAFPCWQILAPGEKSGDAPGYEAMRALTKTRASEETPLADLAAWAAPRREQAARERAARAREQAEEQARSDAFGARARRIYAECGGNPESINAYIFSMTQTMDMDDAALAEAARRSLRQD